MILLLLACTRADVDPEPLAESTPTQDSEPVDPCAFTGVTTLGDLPDPELSELSGLVESRRTPGLLWAHNDSGDSARLFWMEEEGSGAHGIIDLTIEDPVDWEDIAISGAGEDTLLLIGDIGDNKAKREHILIHVLSEPVPGEPAPSVQTLTLQYPDGARDAEAMLVDPVSGDLLILAKSADSEIYRLPTPWTSGTLEQVGALSFGDDGLPGGNRVTGADARDGLVVVRTYTHIFGFPIPTDGGAVEALAGSACELPVEPETQGESIALGEGRYWTISEGVSAPIHRAERP